MKKLKIIFLVTATFLLLQNRAFSQPGSSCLTPYVINTLPFNQAGMTTVGFPINFDNTDACNSNYMTGNDFIFTYTPTVSQHVDISLTNTGYLVGLFVTDDCPSDIGAACIASNEAITGNPSVTNVTLNAGTTYYIIVSTWNQFGLFPSTAFDIQIDLLNLDDLAVTSIINPISGCSLTATEDISIEITNNGTATVDSFEVEYIIDGGTPVTDTIFDSILPGNTLIFTFSESGDFSASNTTYDLIVYSKYADGDATNDTATASITNSPVVNTFPYYEDFETDNGGYGSSGTSSSWAWGTPNKTIITHASSPTKCWVTKLTGNYNQGEASYLNFPCLDFTGLTAPVLEFDIWVATSGLLDYCRVEYSKDDGTSWHTLGQQNDPINWYDDANGWVTAGTDFITVSHRVDSLAGNPNAKLRIYFYGSLITQTDGIAVDDIKIYQAPENDLGITQILYPVSTCGLTATEYIEARIENFGSLPQSNFNVGFSVNGTNSTPELVTATINPGASLLYTFTTPANLGTAQQYIIKCYTGLATDTIHSNDTTSVTINNLLGINTYPYYEDFESSDGGWVSGGLNSSWAWGEPVKPIINHAASPTKCWVTSLTTNSNMLEMSNLMGPCFDFTTLVSPEIEFNIWYSTSSLTPGMDSIVLEVSIDSGDNWSRVGNMNDGFNWYNTINGWSGNSGNWLHARHTLDGAGGEENARIRLNFYGPYATMVEGVAIDDIYIHEAPIDDLGVSEINTPTSSCNLTDHENVGILYTNFGQNAQSHFPLSYQINNGPWNTDTMLYDIYYGESIYHIFTQTADLSGLGTYTIKATTGLADDQDNMNDTVTVVITNVQGISAFPYTEDFEADNGDWYTEGNSTWAWGVPASPIINSAHSPSNAWKTNLTGYALTTEDSYLYSPCMDFTGYSNPYIDLYVWHETSPMMGATVILEASVDGGAFWYIIGPAETNNWYSVISTGGIGWTGSSAGWQYKTHALDNCGNQSGVKLRLHYLFGQFSIMPEEGIAIDDINIYDCLMPDADFTYEANGAEITFTNSSSDAISYLWRFGDGITSGNTNTSHTYDSNGDYEVTLIAYNDCGADSTTQTINISGIGIEGNSYDNNIICSPNPNNGTFNLIINDLTVENLSLDIYNLTGSKVYSEILNSLNGKLVKQIDMSVFDKGVYYMQLTGKDIITVRKIVIE